MKVLLLVLFLAVAVHAAPPKEEMPVKEVNPTPADTPAPPVDATKPVEVPPPVDATKPVEVPPPVDATKPVDVPPPVDATKPVDVPPPVDATKPADVPPPVDATKPAVFPTEAPARADTPTVATLPVNGSCQCAALKQEHYVEEELIGTKTMSFTVDCNEKGHKECRDMCVALAQANKLKAPKKTCEHIKEITVGLKPTLFSKACDAKEWVYTGTKAEEDICCHEGIPTPCKVKKVEVETH